jgi:actin-like protein 6A
VGRDNILVVDCGANHTTVTPILDGNVIEKGIFMYM